MLQVHAFKTGNTIEAYPDSPDYGRIAVATIARKFTDDNWMRTVTNVAFIKSKMTDLNDAFGSLKKGDVFSEDHCVAVRESFEPYYEGQQSQVRPAYTNKAGEAIAEEVLLHEGAPYYRDYYVAPNGTKDSTIDMKGNIKQAALVQEDIA